MLLRPSVSCPPHQSHLSSLNDAAIVSPSPLLSRRPRPRPHRHVPVTSLSPSPSHRHRHRPHHHVPVTLAVASFTLTPPLPPPLCCHRSHSHRHRRPRHVSVTLTIASPSPSPDGSPSRHPQARFTPSPPVHPLTPSFHPLRPSPRPCVQNTNGNGNGTCSFSRHPHRHPQLKYSPSTRLTTLPSPSCEWEHTVRAPVPLARFLALPFTSPHHPHSTSTLMRTGTHSACSRHPCHPSPSPSPSVAVTLITLVALSVQEQWHNARVAPCVVPSLLHALCLPIPCSYLWVYLLWVRVWVPLGLPVRKPAPVMFKYTSGQDLTKAIDNLSIDSGTLARNTCLRNLFM